MNSEHVHELVDLEALGTLGPEESARVRAHVGGCDSCRADLHQAQETTARLALSAPLRRAPATLRAELLRQIGVTPAEMPLRATPRAVSPWLRLSNRWAALAASLVIAPVAGLLTWAVLLQSQVNDLKEESRQVTETQRDVVLLALPTGVKAKLTPTANAGTARGSVSWNPDEGKCVVVVTGLQRLEPGASYRVYYDGPKGVMLAGELRPDAEGTAELVFDTSKWRADEYRVWISAVRPSNETGTVLLAASLRRE